MRWMRKKGKSMWAIYFLTIRVPQSAFFGDKNNALYIINIGIKPIFKDFAKKIKKIVEKVCTYRNYPYLCIRNQEISSYKTKKTVANRKMSNDFEKKLKKKLQKSSWKIWRLQKRILPLQPISASNSSGVFQTVLWFTGYIIERKCSIYLSIPLKEKK